MRTRRGARQCARTEQVARLQLAAVDAVVRHQLRHGPVHAAGVAQGQAVRSSALLAHALGQQQHFEFDIECTGGLVALVQQVRQWLRVAIRACRLGAAERLQRFSRDHPRRDGGNEAFGQERPQGLVFPSLDITRRPVVEQAQAGYVLGSIANRDRLAHVIALANPDAQFQFVVQPRARPKLGSVCPAGKVWPLGRRTSVPDGRMVEARP